MEDRGRHVRDVAVRIVADAEAGARFAEDLLAEELPRLGAADRRLATTLVYGTIRGRGTLDYLLEAACGRPMDRVDRHLRAILRVAAHQRVFLDRVPAYACVSIAVDQARRRGARAAAFVNAALRNLDRLVEAVEPGPVPEGSRTHLWRPDGTFVRLARPVLPPEDDPARRWAVDYSLPQWMIQRWIRRYGRRETLRICRACGEAPAVVARVNSARADRDALIARLRQEGVECAPGEEPDAVRLIRPGAVAAIGPFREGWFFVQDETAMRIARLLDPGPGEAVLDLCAGAGGKVTHIEALRGAGGTVVALDVDAVRLQRLVENVRRLGSVTIRPVRADARRAPWAGGRFDAVLADVPCSNTGVLARRPEARWRLRPADIRTLADLQQALLEAAWQQVRPGGRVAYATCSIEREENERVIEKFVRRHAEARLLRTELRLPEPGRGGGFFALLRKPQ